jgi:phosphate transport system protein
MLFKARACPLAVFQAFLSEVREGGEQLAAADEDIDHEEVLIEEECLKIIALHQPTGLDLRRLATFLKANNDLERIADHATNIAEDVIFMVQGRDIRHHAQEISAEQA